MTISANTPTQLFSIILSATSQFDANLAYIRLSQNSGDSSFTFHQADGSYTNGINQGLNPSAVTELLFIIPSVIPSPTLTPTVTPSFTVAPTATSMPTVAPTSTPTPTLTPTASPLPSLLPTSTPLVTQTPLPSTIATLSPTVSPSISPSPSSTPHSWILDELPYLLTRRLNKAKIGRYYHENIKGHDSFSPLTPVGGNLTMVIEGLPLGLSMDDCEIKTNARRLSQRVVCEIDGIVYSDSKIYHLKVNLIDSTGNQNTQTLDLCVYNKSPRECLENNNSNLSVFGELINQSRNWFRHFRD